MTTRLHAYIEGAGVLGPGLSGWPQAVQVLAGKTAYEPQPTVLPPPSALPGPERRRTGAPVKLALAVGGEAVAASERDAATLATVFAASGGDGQNCHAVCETLAGEDRALSPTRFHNSVQNAPAGYWGIAMRAMAPANVICAYDGSFAAGLLESVTQAAIDARPTLLIAFDTAYPAPIHEMRPIDDAFGVALVLAPQASERTLARIEVRLTDASATTLASPAFEALRLGNPAARALPLVEALAARRSGSVVLEYLDDLRLEVDVAVTSQDRDTAS
ncbi:3-oxoacyl-ACP synthase [Trinickia terrae]|uniref:3-oxoacyl-ACP synthase n=1 Tax=Trinickia terrae TaxID=2571161 RepID=A0A4U1I182_9BURK|nr:beta-ketoacyl synthase chain length factor [Trinickia terrae]TKC86914.1 3-oxoacyl-ACP synthase [Trinickia terrae]